MSHFTPLLDSELPDALPLEHAAAAAADAACWRIAALVGQVLTLLGCFGPSTALLLLRPLLSLAGHLQVEIELARRVKLHCGGHSPEQ